MSNPDELALVRKAILSKITGCFEWHEGESRRLRHASRSHGLAPIYIKQKTYEFVLSGGDVLQVQEKRPQYSHREYYYKVIFPEPGFPSGIFVEMELTDDDPDVPSVTLLNYHTQP